MILFKFTFPMKDFPICFNGTHSHLHFFEQFSACGGFRCHFQRSSHVSCHLESVSLRKLEVLTQLSESPRSISGLPVCSSQL